MRSCLIAELDLEIEMALYLEMIGDTFFLKPNSLEDLDIAWDCYFKQEKVTVIPSSCLKTMLEHLPVELHHLLEVDVSLNPFRVAQAESMFGFRYQNPNQAKIQKDLLEWRQSTSEQFHATKSFLNV